MHANKCLFYFRVFAIQSGRRVATQTAKTTNKTKTTATKTTVITIITTTTRHACNQVCALAWLSVFECVYAFMCMHVLLSYCFCCCYPCRLRWFAAFILPDALAFLVFSFSLVFGFSSSSSSSSSSFICFQINFPFNKHCTAAAAVHAHTRTNVCMCCLSTLHICRCHSPLPLCR